MEKVICIGGRRIPVTPEFSEWFGAWIGDGDHSPKKKSITLTNQCLELLKLHIDILIQYFGYNISKIRAEVVTSSSESDDAVRKRWATKLSLPSQNMRSVIRTPLASEECSRVVVNSAQTYRKFLQSVPSVKSAISKSTPAVKAAYIQGIFAAEGSIRKVEKHIRLTMKEENEVLFAQNLLGDLDIESSLKFNKANGAFELSIFGFDNFRKFKALGGFGRYKRKNDLLEKHIDSYENKLPWHYRFQLLKSLLLKKYTVTNKGVMKELNMNYHNAKLMTATFAKQGLLKVDKSKKTYVYSLNKN